MKITMHDLATRTFTHGLESLDKLLEKAEAYAAEKNIDLINARLAPDMFTFAQQVQIVCFFARDTMGRLAGKPTLEFGTPDTSFAAMRRSIAEALDTVRSTPVEAFEGAEERDCSVEPSNANIVVKMDGLTFLRDWVLAHFYFHFVTAYDILRHNGLAIGKLDFASWAGAFIRPKG